MVHEQDDPPQQHHRGQHRTYHIWCSIHTKNSGQKNPSASNSFACQKNRDGKTRRGAEKPFWGGPPPFRPAPFWAPAPLAPNFRGSLAAPTLRGPRIQAPTLRAEALRASTFSVFGPPYVPHFIIFLICSFFCALFFVSISCHFFLNLSLFLFILIFFHIFQSLCFFFSKKNYFLSFLSFFFKLGGGKPKPVTSF